MIESIKEKAKIILAQNDDAHGYWHAERVANLSEQIRRHEGGDQLIIETASYMHDWCVHKGREYHISNKAMEEIRCVLYAANFPQDKGDSVIDAIKHHEDYNFNGKWKRLSIEGQILQDADRLDALGAIGIGRVLFCIFTKPTIWHTRRNEKTRRRISCKSNYLCY